MAHTHKQRENIPSYKNIWLLFKLHNSCHTRHTAALSSLTVAVNTHTYHTCYGAVLHTASALLQSTFCNEKSLLSNFHFQSFQNPRGAIQEHRGLNVRLYHTTYSNTCNIFVICSIYNINKCHKLTKCSALCLYRLLTGCHVFNASQQENGADLT